jgi:uncharacterized protein (TIGR02231 family)
MLKRLLVTLPFTLAALPAFAADIATDSHITAVTVYADRAAVTRTASVELPAGASTVVLTGLPESLFPDSLRAEGEAQGDVILGAIENKIVSSAELAAPRERELNDKLQGLNDQRALLAADQQALQSKQQFLTTLTQQGSLRARENIAAIDLKPEQWSGAAETVGKNLSDTLRALAGKAVELRQIDEQVAAVQTELSQLQTGARNAYQVKVPLESHGTTRLTLRVTYQIPNAFWAPIYDARLDTSNGKLALTQFGDVRQQTGEDWSGVKLTLSTAQPARNATLPPLYPMWVSLYDPRAANGRARRAEMEMDSARSNVGGMVADSMVSAAPMAMEAPAPVMKQATFQAATLNAGGYVSEYAIPGTADILADGTSKKVMIGNLEVSSKLVAKIKPLIDQQAYLVAITKLGGETPLLPGRANLFRDGAFIGTSDLAMLRPGQETDISFGIDDQMVVKHDIVKDEVGEDGVISRDSTRTRLTATSVQNLHKIPVSVMVLQTIPSSQNEDIKVQILPETRSGYDRDVDNITGQLRWNFTLQPQQKDEVRLGWSLSWPKGQSLTGLPF